MDNHTVRAILGNPRYTGRQVWNRQRTDRELVDPANTGLGHRPVQRWTLPEGWVISARPAHPALVTEADFIAVQDLGTRSGPASPAGCGYLLAGLLRCGTCGRLLESCWSNGKAAYRCRHGRTTATAAGQSISDISAVRDEEIGGGVGEGQGDADHRVQDPSAVTSPRRPRARPAPAPAPAARAAYGVLAQRSSAGLGRLCAAPRISVTVPFAEGDAVLFDTNGVTEASYEEGRFFPLAARAAQCDPQRPRAFVDELADEVVNHVGHPPDDEIAVLLACHDPV